MSSGCHTTLMRGLRFDVTDGITQENQLSPRINVVWQPDDMLTRAGYARYFTPPPLAQVNNGAIAATAGTTAAPALTTNDPVRAERSNYFDAGVELRPTDGLKFGLDAYYKTATNLLDEGQFGAPIILTSFNYAYGRGEGRRAQRQLSTRARGRFRQPRLVGGQGHADQLRRSSTSIRPSSPSSRTTGSTSTTTRAGPARPAPPTPSTSTSDYATRVSADFIYGTACARPWSRPTTRRCRAMP